MRVASSGVQRGTNCATAGASAAGPVIEARHQSERPARRIAGVAAQKSRAAACTAEGCGSLRRVQRKIASVASTASAAPLMRVQSRMGAVSGAEKSIGLRGAYSTALPGKSICLSLVFPRGATNCRGRALVAAERFQDPEEVGLLLEADPRRVVHTDAAVLHPDAGRESAEGMGEAGTRLAR